MTEPDLSRRITSLQTLPITHSVSSYQKMISQDLAAEAIPLANKVFIVARPYSAYFIFTCREEGVPRMQAM